MKKIIWGLAITVVLGGMFPSLGFGIRPLITEDAGTVEKGAAEIEIGFDYIREDNRDKRYAPSLQVAYGFTNRLEMAVGFPYIFLDPKEGERVDGVGDLYTYLKYRVWGEREFYPALTLKPFLKFPTADENKGLGSGKTDFGLTAAFSESFRGFNLHLDGTYVVYGEKHVTDQLSLGLAGEVEIAKGFNLVTEVRYGNNFNTSHRDDPATLKAGFQALIAGAFVDAGATLGLNRAAPDYLLTVGITLKFK